MKTKKDVTLRSWLSLLNFKANHRKLIVADELVANRGGESVTKMSTLITSGNPHNASSAHGNVALKIDDKVWREVTFGEATVAALSGVTLTLPDQTKIFDASGTLSVTVLRDEGIRNKVLDIVRAAREG